MKFTIVREKARISTAPSRTCEAADDALHWLDAAAELQVSSWWGGYHQLHCFTMECVLIDTVQDKLPS